MSRARATQSCGCGPSPQVIWTFDQRRRSPIRPTEERAQRRTGPDADAGAANLLRKPVGSGRGSADGKQPRRPRYWGTSTSYPNILWKLAAKFVKFLCTSHAPTRTGGDLRLQVLLREGRSRLSRPGHRRRRTQRLRKIEHLRCSRLGSGRAERARAAWRADGRRHLQRLRQTPAPRDGGSDRDARVRQRQRQRRQRGRRSGPRAAARRPPRLPRRRGRVLSERQAGPLQGRSGSPARDRSLRARVFGHRTGTHRPGAVDEAPGSPPADRRGSGDHPIQGEEEARRGQARRDTREPSPPFRHRQRSRAQLRFAEAPGLARRALQGVLGSAARSARRARPGPGRHAGDLARGRGASARRTARRRGSSRRGTRPGGGGAHRGPHRGGRQRDPERHRCANRGRRSRDRSHDVP